MIIRKKTLFIYFSIFSLVLGSSAYFKLNNTLALVIDVIQLFALVYCFINLYLQRMIGAYFWIILLLYFLLGVSTLSGSKQYATYIVYTVQALSATIFIRYGIKNHIQIIFAAIRNVLVLVIAINLILLIAFPGGLTISSNQIYHLLGNRIGFTPFLLAAIFFSFVQDYIEGRSKISIYTRATIILCIFTALIESISTGIVAIFISLFILFVLFRLKINIDLFWFYIIYFIIFIGIVVFNIQYHIPVLSYILIDVLKEDLTFDNRTTIWFAAIEGFLRKPIWGHGISGGGNILVQFQYLTKTLTAHNQILNLLYEGGAATFSAFLLLCFNIRNNIRRCSDRIIAEINIAFVIGFFFVMFTEVQMEKSIIFLVFATAANCLSVMQARDSKLIGGSIK